MNLEYYQRFWWSTLETGIALKLMSSSFNEDIVLLNTFITVFHAKLQSVLLLASPSMPFRYSSSKSSKANFRMDMDHLVFTKTCDTSHR